MTRVPGSHRVGVVGRRALGNEGEVAGALVGRQQLGEVLGAGVGVRRVDAQDQERGDLGQPGLPREVDGDGHAALDGDVVVEHPGHPGVRAQAGGVEGDAGSGRVGAGDQVVGHRLAGHAEDLVVSVPADGDEVIGHQAHARRRVDLLGCDVRERQPVGRLGRLRQTRDVPGAPASDPVDEPPKRLRRAPGVGVAHRPEGPGMVELGRSGCHGRRVQMHLIRVDADAQVLAVGGEAGLDANRQQQQRHVDGDRGSRGSSRSMSGAGTSGAATCSTSPGRRGGNGSIRSGRPGSDRSFSGWVSGGVSVMGGAVLWLRGRRAAAPTRGSGLVWGYAT